MHFEIGAPLMIKTDHAGYKRYTQYGILSTGLQDSDINLFVDITKYMKWILDTIKVWIELNVKMLFVPLRLLREIKK